MALKRKLTALEYDKLTTFNIEDEKCFRNTVTWIEDKKIHHYKELSDGALLRDIENEAWPQAYKQYLAELKCPHNINDYAAVMNWLLGYSTRLEDESRNKHVAMKEESISSTSQSTNNDTLANIDFNDPRFKASVASLAKLFQVPPNPDHLKQLKAICIIVREGGLKKTLGKNDSSEKPKDNSLEKTISGLDASSYILDSVDNILRLLHIKELKELQVNINRILVEIEAIIAMRNSKTTSRSKVRRK